MTRFQEELRGDLGDFWQKDALKRLQAVQQKLQTGSIVISDAGVARNSIGRPLMDDQLEILAMVSSAVDVEATRAAREQENEAFLSKYRATRHPLSVEEHYEMLAAFGPGVRVVDVITGETTEI